MKYLFSFPPKKNSGWSHQRVIYLHPSEHSRNNDWLEEMQRKHCGFQAKSGFFFWGGGACFTTQLKILLPKSLVTLNIPQLVMKIKHNLVVAPPSFFPQPPPFQPCYRSSAPEKQTSKSLVWHLNKLTF